MTTCRHCGKITKNKLALQKHQRVHSIKRSCDICGGAFARKEYLIEHMTAHHSDVQLNCNLCTKMFRSKQRLHRHQRLAHDKKFKCPSSRCNAAFAVSTQLVEHVNSKHEGKRYQCTYLDCSYKFALKRSAARHLRTDHNLQPKSDVYKFFCDMLTMK